MPPRYHHHFYRAAFLLLCVAPTVYTIGWIVERRMAIAAAAAQAESLVPVAQEELARILGVKVTLARMEYLPEKITRLTDVSLYDPETGNLLATAAAVEMYYAQRGTLAIEPSGVVLQADQLSRLAEVLHTRVLRELPAATQIELASARVQVTGGPREETLSDVHLTIRLEGSQRQAIATFRPAWSSEGEPLQLEIVRRPGEPRPQTEVAFHTSEQSLPANWFAPLLPSVAQLGDACTLQGSLIAREEQSGWEFTFRGMLRQVELDRVVARRLRPYPLGTADLQLDHARWRSDRLVEAEGLIQADALQLSLRALTESFAAMDFSSPNPQEAALTAAATASPASLRCMFSLDAQGLVLLGEQGTVLKSGSTPLLGQPASKLPWNASLVTLCSELGIPPLEAIPPELQPQQSGVRLRD